MSYIIRGLSPEPFTHLFNQTSEILAAYGAVRKTADAAPGYPCRISLEDAALGEQVILLNHESHTARTPYRSAYAIYIRTSQARKGLPQTPPCAWCGLGIGCFCDLCHALVCTKCDQDRPRSAFARS